MKTKQCHHFIVLIGLLIGCLLPATVGASVKVGNFYYNLNASDFTAEFTHRPDDNGHYTEAVISIPASINYGDNTYRVTSIGDYAFTYEDLPVDNRFNDHLTTVEIPNSVIKIGKGIFLGCSSLASIIVESGNTTFDSRNNCNAIIETATNTLLAGCPNTIIPNSVTSIGDEAFAYCWGLTEIDIPNSVTRIGNDAFYECGGLTSLTIPGSVNEIGRYAFYACYSLNSLTIMDGVSIIRECAFFTASDYLTSIIIPPSVQTIFLDSFEIGRYTSVTVEWTEPVIPQKPSYYDDLENPSFCWGASGCTLHVPNGTVEAYRNADFWSEFENIEELTLNVDGIYYNISPSTMTASVTKKPSGYYSGDITIPETVSLDDKTYRVTEIEELAFYDCKSLTSVTIPNGVTSIGYQAFYNCTRLTSIDIPNSVTSIGRGAFSNCAGLISVTIPNGVTTIEPETFNMCNSLASVIIPNGVTSIGNMAFCRCFDLTSVTIPNGVTSIGYEAFLYCTGLTSVTIPNSVTSISNEAFSNCTDLTSITCENETPVTITNSVFSGVNKSTCTLNVPTGSKSAYQSAAVWCDFANIVEYEGASPSVLATGQCGDNLTYTIYDDMSMVITGTGAMWNYNSDNPMNSDYKYIIKSVTIEEGCTAIGDDAFYGCTGLTSVDIPSSVTTIGEEAFEDCTGLTSIFIPNSVTSIGEDAFLNCRALTTISVDAGNSIYDSRNDCNAIIETSTNKLIVGCRNTVIPNSVTSIGMNALACCTGLTSVDIPNSVTSIDDFAFQFCTGLTSVSIPNSVSSIAATAFSNCSGLTSIYVDASNATYDSRENCNAIIETSTNTLTVGCKNTVIPSSVTIIGQSAFHGCTGLTSVDIPNGVTSIDWCAFQDCIGLTSVSIPNRVTRIGQYAFYRCTSLSSISVGMTTPLVINDNVFYDVNKSTCTLYVPTGSKSAYQSADVWKDFTNIVEYEGASPSVLATGQCGDNLTYTIYDDMSMVITGTGAMWDYVAEDTHPNQDYYSDVKSVTIEEGCTYVGKYAFDLMGSLTDVTIPGSVIEIGTGAFSYCRQLSSLELSAGLKIIGGGAFECCGRQDSGLKSITIPSTVTSIGGAAFTSCYLNSITVESSTPLTIQANTFASTDVNSCTLYVPTGSKSAYQSADIWKDFTNIVEYEGASPSVLATGQCGDNLTYTIYDDLSMVITGTGAMWDYSEEAMMNSDYMGSIKSVTFEEGCTAIGAYAFNCCYEVTSVTFPNSLTAISECAFKYCVKLISLNIPNGVIAIGDYAFDNCCNLSSITVDDGNTAYDSRDNCNAIINTELDKLILGCKNTVIPVGVTSIGERAFICCQGLTSIDIPDGVTEIGWWAFMSCHDLTTVSIPHGVTQIGAFAFLDCNSLTAVAIPNSVTYLGGNAFTSCTGLTSVTVEWNTPLEIESNVFENVDKSACILYVPTGTKSAYQSADVWKDFTNIVEYEGASSVVLATGQCGDNLTYTIYDDLSMVISGTGAMWIYNSFDEPIYADYYDQIKRVIIGEGVTSIGDYAFNRCTSLSSITIPNSVTSIGWSAFSHCTSLSSISIPSSVTSIDKNAFYCCTSLSSITIPNSVTSIGYRAFSNCISLTSLTIPNSVTSIGDWAFSTCISLSSITIPNSVTSIGNHAFEICTSLTSVSIPYNVNSIGYGVFSGCTNLSVISVSGSNTNFDSRDNCNAIIETSTNTLIAGCKNTVIPSSVTCIGEEAFSKCTNLSSITIPSSVTSIDISAFEGCTGLTSVEIPSSVTTIGWSVFKNCTGLTSVDIPNSVTSIGESAFSSCTSLSSITIPSSVTSIGESAFADCTGLSSIIVDSGNSHYDSRNNCNAIIGTSTNELIVGCKNTVIPNSVTSIGDYAFNRCASLSSITIPNSVTSIGDRAFFYCTSLSSITIPSSVTSIGNHAFEYCISLSSISVGMTTPLAIPDNVFYDVNKSTCTLYVPTGCKTAYQEAEVWGEFENIVEIGDEPDTDISALDNAIYVERTRGMIGETMDLSVKIKNDFSLRGFKFKLELPAGATINSWKVSTQRLPTGASLSDVIRNQKIDGNKITVAGSLNYESGFTGDDGEIATVNVTFANDMEAGTYPIFVTDCDLSDPEGSDMFPSDVKSTLVLTDFLAGDANGDGQVRIGDAIAVLNYIVGNSSDNFNEKAADVNGDGRVLIGDVIFVLNIIVNQ